MTRAYPGGVSVEEGAHHPTVGARAGWRHEGATSAPRRAYVVTRLPDPGGMAVGRAR